MSDRAEDKAEVDGAAAQRRALEVIITDTLAARGALRFMDILAATMPRLRKQNPDRYLDRILQGMRKRRTIIFSSKLGWELSPQLKAAARP